MSTMRQLPQLRQIVPSSVCFACDVCCRFLDSDSFLAPIFTETEMTKAVAHGIDAGQFKLMPDGRSQRVQLKPHEDMYICPCFNPETNECTIYAVRPLDCQIYPFALMYDSTQTSVVLGVDRICPYGEAEIQTEAFQRYIHHIVDYLESDVIVQTIAANWSLIGPYQESVTVVSRLDNLNRALVEQKRQHSKSGE